MTARFFVPIAALSLLFSQPNFSSAQAEGVNWAGIDKEYSAEILPLLERYCLKCLSTRKHKGELDLERPLAVGFLVGFRHNFLVLEQQVS